MQTLHGQYCLKEQRGSRGYYASVSLSVELTAGNPGTLDIEIQKGVDTQWREALIVGVRTGWSFLPSKHTCGNSAQVTITALQWHAVDTWDLVVMYATSKAMLAAFEETRTGPVFVPEFGIFLFSRC